MELDFDLYHNGTFYGRVWLTQDEMSQLEKIGRAVSGRQRYRLKTNHNAIYVSNRDE